MALNIKNPRVERLAAEVAELTGETKTEAIRRSLEERKERLAFRVAGRDRTQELRRFMEREIWPLVPAKVRGKRVTRAERERILGYGPDGV
jgi:antitoxin VapB